MLTESPVTGRTEVPADTGPLLLRMDYTDPRVAVLDVVGELDLATTPQLERLLWSRLRTTTSALVIDIGKVTFLGLDGLALLADAHAYADRRGIAVGLVNSSHAVDRALAAGGPETHLPCFDDVPAAVAACRAGTADHSRQEETKP